MCLGIPGMIEKIEDRWATVNFSDVSRRVSLDLVDGEAKVGDYVLVHAGFALEVVDEDEAKATLKLLREMGI